MKMNSLLSFSLITLACITSACSGISGPDGSDQLTQRLIQQSSLNLNSQNLKDMTQGCSSTPASEADEKVGSPAGSVGIWSDTSIPISPNSAALVTSGEFSVSFKEGGLFQLLVSDEVLVTGTWKAMDADTIELTLQNTTVQIDVDVTGDSLNTSCDSESSSPVMSPGGVSSSPEDNRGDFPEDDNRSDSPDENVGENPIDWDVSTPSDEDCPSYLYLEGPGSYGDFTGNGGLPAFKLAETRASLGQQTTCVYTRPQTTTYAEFVASFFPDGAQCVGHNVDSFECKGKANVIVLCPHQIDIGPIAAISYGDYGQGALLPVPNGWQVQGDQMTMKKHDSVDIWPQYGPQGLPAMRCLYTDFGSVQVTLP